MVDYPIKLSKALISMNRFSRKIYIKMLYQYELCQERFVKNDFVDSQNSIVVNLEKTVEMLYKEVVKKSFYYCDELRN